MGFTVSLFRSKINIPQKHKIDMFGISWSLIQASYPYSRLEKLQSYMFLANPFIISKKPKFTTHKETKLKKILRHTSGRVLWYCLLYCARWF